jgi:leucyl aminopeptidase
MEFSTKAGSPEKLKGACLVVGAYADRKLSASASLVDAASKGALTNAIKHGDLNGKRGSTLLLHGLPGIQAERVLVVGLGKQDELTDRTFAEAARAAFRALTQTGAKDAVVCLAEAAVPKRTHADNVRQCVTAAREVTYRFDVLKSKKEEPLVLKKVAFASDKASAAAVEAGIAEGTALSNGIDLAKTLGNLPGNVCTPTYLADTAKKLAREFHLKVDILDRKHIEALKMGSFLSVTRGSDEPPKIVCLTYSGAAAKNAPVVLIGKGITFDTGGISIKPADAMDEMKYDMCGAASVLGTMRAIAEMNLKINVVGIVAACENMPSGTATKPGDIVTSMSGQTVEILNTDAEGRLILADALTYAERFKPACVIDIATLTGACVIALGNINSGLFSPDDQLAAELLAAGQAASDPTWRMPLEEEYQEQLKSNFADFANIGGRPGGSITAACFLWRFAKNFRWAHLDIAGTAWKSGSAKGGTGRPVALLTTFLKQRASA